MTHSRFHYIPVAFVLLGWGLLSGGCSSVKVPSLTGDSEKETSEIKGNDPLEIKAAPKAKPLKREVRTDGALLLGQTDNLAFSSDQIAETLTRQASSNNWNIVRHFIRKYPDLIGQALLEGKFSSENSSVRRIAVLFDRLWSKNGANSWYELYSNNKFQDFDELRNQFLQQMKNGQLDEALKLKLSSQFQDSSNSIALAEAYRLEGLAYLLKEDYPQAERRFGKSLALFTEVQPLMASSVGLMLGESYRKQSKKEQWRSAWENSVRHHAGLISSKKLRHPAFWKNAAFVKPIHSGWPSEVREFIAKDLSKKGLDSVRLGTELSDEILVWAFIGQSSLDRGESQNAILAFKKAEAMVGSREAKNEFQLRQASAMIGGGQPGPATAILIRLGSDKMVFGDRARAVLGTLKLQEGSLAQGMNLLQNAIKSSGAWPEQERMKAMADYGLAYLMRGKESEGIALLMDVHRQFLEQQDLEQAEQILQNLAIYFEKTEQPGRQKETVASIKKMNQF